MSTLERLVRACRPEPASEESDESVSEELLSESGP